jgi:hypothetical protein
MELIYIDTQAEENQSVNKGTGEFFVFFYRRLSGNSKKMEFTERANTKNRPSHYLRLYNFCFSGFRVIVGANLVFARISNSILF